MLKIVEGADGTVQLLPPVPPFCFLNSIDDLAVRVWSDTPRDCLELNRWYSNYADTMVLRKTSAESVPSLAQYCTPDKNVMRDGIIYIYIGARL